RPQARHAKRAVGSGDRAGDDRRAALRTHGHGRACDGSDAFRIDDPPAHVALRDGRLRGALRRRLRGDKTVGTEGKKAQRDGDCAMHGRYLVGWGGTRGRLGSAATRVPYARVPCASFTLSRTLTRRARCPSPRALPTDTPASFFAAQYGRD